MADEQTQANPSPAPQSTPAPSTAPTIAPEVQAMIEAARQQAYNAGAADARRSLESKLKPPPAPVARTEPAPEQRNTPAPVTDALAILRLRDDFDDAIGDLTLTGPQKKFLREQVMATQPADVAAYVRTFAEVWAKPAPSTPTNQPTATPSPGAPATQAHPVTANGAPSNATTVTTPDVPIYKRTREQQEALAREMGPKAFIERHMRELRERNVRVRG